MHIIMINFKKNFKKVQQNEESDVPFEKPKAYKNIETWVIRPSTKNYLGFMPLTLQK